MDDLFTHAKALRDAGMATAAKAQDSAAPKWSAIAYAAIEAIARRKIIVHIDDVMAAGVPAPAHPNAWGGVWLRATRAGIIQKTVRMAPCKTDPKKHAHQYPVYLSRIYDPRCQP